MKVELNTNGLQSSSPTIAVVELSPKLVAGVRASVRVSARRQYKNLCKPDTGVPEAVVEVDKSM